MEEIWARFPRRKATIKFKVTWSKHNIITRHMGRRVFSVKLRARTAGADPVKEAEAFAELLAAQLNVPVPRCSEVTAS